MRSFKSFLTEANKLILSDQVYDFLGHLMSGFDDHSKIKHSTITEASVYTHPSLLNKSSSPPTASAPEHPEPEDHTNPLINHLRNQTINHKGTDVLIHGFNMLDHPAVKGRNNAEEGDRYKNLMKRGQEIFSRVRNIHQNVKQGFAEYSKKITSGFDPRKDSGLQQSEEKLRNSNREVGFAAKATPKWLSGNTKTEKNEKLGDITAGLSLAPAKMANVGTNTACAKATDNCDFNCLGHSAGQNSLLSAINSKIAKHQFFVEHPQHAAHMIHSELLDHVDQVAKWNKEKAPGEKPLEASFRPNVVSDFHFARDMTPIINHVTEYAKQKHGLDFTVRDYTKHAERLYQPRPSNYHMALSHTGANHSESNDEDVSKALEHGHTVAAVIHGDATHFYDHRTKRLYPIDDGDKDDRIEDGHKNQGHTVGRNEQGNQVGYNQEGKLEGVVRALRIKGSTNEVKQAADKFVSPTTTIMHNGEEKKVIEINSHLKSQ